MLSEDVHGEGIENLAFGHPWLGGTMEENVILMMEATSLFNKARVYGLERALLTAFVSRACLILVIQGCEVPRGAGFIEVCKGAVFEPQYLFDYNPPDKKKCWDERAAA